MDIEQTLAYAKRLRIQHRFQDAVDLLSEAISVAEDDRLVYERGYCCDLDDRVDQARKDYTRAIELAPKNSKYRLSRGLLLTQALQQTTEAIEDLTSVIELDPDSIEAHQELSLSYLLIPEKDVEKAVSHAEEAIRLAPDQAHSYYCYGESLIAAGRFAEAETALRNAVEMEPEWASHWYALANAQRNLGDLVASVESAQKACHLEPDDYEWRQFLGGLQLQMKRYPEAIKNLQAALRLEPDEDDRMRIENAIAKATEASR